MTYTDPEEAQDREQKLPVWAQDTINMLRRKVKDERGRADQARRGGGPEDTDTLLDAYDDVPVRLRKGEQVTFRLGERYDQYLQARVTTAYQGKTVLAIHGGATLVILPQVTNGVQIAVVDR